MIDGNIFTVCVNWTDCVTSDCLLMYWHLVNFRGFFFFCWNFENTSFYSAQHHQQANSTII